MTSTNMNSGETMDRPNLDEPLTEEIMQLLEQGKTRRTTILPGTERPNKGVDLYAQTHVEIEFSDEENLRRCVKLLHWSDQRLSRLPALLAMWDWQQTAREGMKLYFSTGWYDKDFFDERNTAFMSRTHSEYFQMFGAKTEDLKVRHEVMVQANA